MSWLQCVARFWRCNGYRTWPVFAGGRAKRQSGTIGMSLALTGAGASPSKVINTDLAQWRDDIDATGGLLDRPVELVIYDDQSTPANVPGIYNQADPGR